MGIMKWLINAALKSDDKFMNEISKDNERRWAQNNATQNYKNSIDCCANCLWFDRYASGGRLNCCTKHNFCYSLEDVEYRQVEYKKVCNDFYRK